MKHKVVRELIIRREIEIDDLDRTGEFLSEIDNTTRNPQYRIMMKQHLARMTNGTLRTTVTDSDGNVEYTYEA